MSINLSFTFQQQLLFVDQRSPVVLPSTKSPLSAHTSVQQKQKEIRLNWEFIFLYRDVNFGKNVSFSLTYEIKLLLLNTGSRFNQAESYSHEYFFNIVKQLVGHGRINRELNS